MTKGTIEMEATTARSAARAQRGRSNAYALAALGAAGAAIGGVQLAVSPAGERYADTEICILSDAPMVEGLTRGCYKRGDLAAFLKRPVLGRNEAPVAVALADPKDDLAPLAVVRTCAEYDALVGRKWFALSSREMRSQANLIRACGALAMMRRSRPADETYFSDGAMSETDMRAMADGPPFRFAEARLEAPSDGAAMSKPAPGVWRLSTGDQIAELHEIAHADFNKDGLGDMLALVSINVVDGTATAAELGLVLKTSADGAVTFAPRSNEAPGAERRDGASG